MLIKKTNKKAVSVMVGYVLLIIISLSLAAAVYTWLSRLSDIEPLDSCEKGVSLIVNDYGYEEDSKKLIINLKNKGNFNISGFFIRVTDKEDVVPYIGLSPADGGVGAAGRYDFKRSGEDVPLASGEIIQTNFTYEDEQGKENDIKKLQIIPYRRMKNEKGIKELVKCNNAKRIIDIDWNKALQEAPTSSLGEDDSDGDGSGNGNGGGENGGNGNGGEEDGGGGEEKIPDSLVSWWRFEDKNGDDEIGGYNATSYGNIDFVNGKIEDAMKISNGETNSYLKVDGPFANLKLTNDFTLETWVKLNSIPKFDYAYIIGEFSGTNVNYGLKINQIGGIEFYYANKKVIESSDPIETDKWHYIAAIKEGEDFTLDIKNEDGDIETLSETSADTTLYGDTNSIYLGRVGNGSTDEVAVYNESLDEIEIQEHYDNTKNGNKDYFGNSI